MYINIPKVKTIEILFVYPNPMRNILFLCIVGLMSIVVIPTQAQLTLISPYNNYNSSLGMLQNPAAIGDSKLSYQINLLTAHLNAGNTAVEVKRSTFFQAIYKNNAIEDKDVFRITSKAFHNGWSNIDILGPSVVFNINKQNTIGIYSRLRNTLNITNVNDNALDIITDDIQTVTDYNLGIIHLQTNIFGEMGVSYSHILLDEPKHVIKIGITPKYILGMGAFTTHTIGATVGYKPTRDNYRMLTGDARLLYSKDIGTINSDNINTSDVLNILGKNIVHNVGFGVDAGFIYEWRPEGAATNYLQIKNWLATNDHSYKLRVGLSVTDIGYINYKAGTASANYALTGTNKPENTFEKLSNETVDQYVNRLKTAGIITLNKVINKFTMRLPTVMHINADWHIYKPFYVNANVLINLISMFGNQEATYYPTTFSLAPRFETRWVNAFLPLSYNQFDIFSIGIGAQVGPLLIGSESLISNLFNNRIRSVHAFVGLNFPIYKKRPELYCYSMHN